MRTTRPFGVHRYVIGLAGAVLMAAGLGAAGKAKEPATPDAPKPEAAPAERRPGAAPDTSGAPETPDTADAPQPGEQPETDSARRPGESTAPGADRRPRQGRDNGQPASLGVMLYEEPGGVLHVRRVLPGSPAEQAGLRQGDEILIANGQRVTGAHELRLALARTGGEMVELGLLRGNQFQSLKTTLASWEDVFGREQDAPRQARRRDAFDDRDFDTADRPRSRRDSDERDFATRRRDGVLGVSLDSRARDGAWVARVHPESPAEEAGIRVGDEILAVDGQEIASAEDLMEVLSGRRPGESLELDINRQGRTRTIEATLASPAFLAEGQPDRLDDGDRRRRNGRGDSRLRNGSRLRDDSDFERSGDRDNY